MHDTIISKLDGIKQDKGIRMLYACESGSRGWEFPSPDSDYDVRFIYVRPLAYYFSVMQRDDMLSFTISDELDIYGWDIRKVLQLMRKSNTTPFEWLQSPIVYRAEPGIQESLRNLSRHFFSRRGNTHHYLGIARGALNTVTGSDEIKIKKLFYVLRPLLAAKWCLQKNSIAPMQIGPLMTLLPQHLQKTVTDLIGLKSGAPEGFIIAIDPALRQWIDEEFAACSSASSGLPADNFAADLLDEYFREIVVRYDDTGFKG